MLGILDIVLLVVFGLYTALASYAQFKDNYDDAGYYQRWAIMIVIIICMRGIVESLGM